ncbi:hypothetical protein [Paenibacillus periandrae]|uniref:hypothetical protein n=1 Tax=Paenibacillus periandrae TaxID=1761741 RepID=UPI001F08EB0C|nr:hypothetical protein [Paenibacillus periandrae]
MFDKLMILLILFIVFVYLFNLRGIKNATLALIVSGQKETVDQEKDVRIIKKHIMWYTRAIVALCLVLLALGVVTIREFVILLFQN